MSVANSRALDHRATTDFGIPSILLMENAAIAIANHALDLLKSARSQSILIAAGPGNNAGDAFAAARHLATLGCPPTIVMTTPAEHITADAKINLDIITKMNIPTIDAQTYLESDPPQPGLIIDALFGTGLTRPIEGIAQQLITHINAARASGSLVLAVDVPSGLNAQTGEPMGDAIIQADRTLTFAALKDGYRNFNAQPHLGEVHIAPLAIPTELLTMLGTRLHQSRDKAPPG
jgi:hydroxyethylthiazole kinase-like uncharacterized protein yjeF